LFHKRATRTKKKYAKLVKRAESDEEVLLVDKKLSAIKPCPIECLTAFGLSATKNAPLAINRLRRDVRAMKLPQKVASNIIEDVISVFLSAGLIDSTSSFSSIEAEENAARALEDSKEEFRRLMRNMRMSTDDL
jgi:hypothetical protein